MTSDQRDFHFWRLFLGFALFAGCIGTDRAFAVEQRLSDFSYVSHLVDHGSVEISTSGVAKLRITFYSAGTVRIQVSPSGQFKPNLSKAVNGTPKTHTNTKVESDGEMLLIRNASFTLRIDKKHLRVDVYDASNTRAISMESPDDGTSWDTASGKIRQSRTLGETERLYGLGQDNTNHGTLDRRGTRRDMWTGQQIKSGNVTASYPIPFYLSTGVDQRGYGCLVDNSWHMQFDMGKSHHDVLTWTAPGGPIDYYLFVGPSFKQIINEYTELTGRPSMLPIWAFGFWQSRCFYKDFPEIKKVADREQKDGIPLDVVVVDSSWSLFGMNYKWSDKFLAGKSAKEWIDSFHARGLKVIVSTKGPMVRPDADIYPEAAKEGVFASDGKGNPITAGYFSGHLLDVTSPNFASWLSNQLTPLSRDGTDGWWLDLNEPEGEPPQAVYHEGNSANTHNRYSLLNNKAYFDYCRENDPNCRPVILGRAATAGMQRYSGIVWTGDINSDWPTFRAHIPEIQNAGLSGLPYWTNDSGGFLSGFLNKDRYGAHAALYERWFEFTCFAPIARAHKSGPSEPYQFGGSVEKTARKYLDLRYRLMPYIYRLAKEATTSGLPMVRPLVLEFQNDPGSATAKTEFLFGPDLLVAPVIWANAVSRDVYFPPGDWISYDEGFQVGGGQTIGVTAPRDRIPLFVRDGAILPMAPEMTSTGQKPWDPITMEVWPHGESTGSLYQDDGTTLDFEKGACTTTAFTSREVPGKSIAFKIDPSNSKFGPTQWVLDFHMTSVPKSVSANGNLLSADQWTFERATSLLTVKLAGHHAAESLTVEMDGSTLPRAASPKITVPPPDENDMARGPVQTAQFLPPPRLPIRIEAANYDKGGEGLAFHVERPYATDVYRTDGVPIANSSDAGGGYMIPGLKEGEWLAYTIDAVDGGWFKVSARARLSGRGELTLLRGRTVPLTTLTATTGTAAPQLQWTSVEGGQAFYLPPGEQLITFATTHAGLDLGYFTFEKINELGVAVEAESGVLTNATVRKDHHGFSGAGFVSGVQNRDSSVVLTLNSPSAGKFLAAIRYADGGEDAEIGMTCNGGQQFAIVLHALPNWEDYGEASFPIELKKGENQIRLSGTGHGSVNLDQLRLISSQQK